MVSVTRQKPPSVYSNNNTGSGSVPPKDTPKGKFPPFLHHFKASAANDAVVYKVGNTKEYDSATWYFCDCTTHRDRIKWHKLPATDCCTRKKWLANSGSDASPPAAHVSDGDELSILTDKYTADSSATTLLASAMSKVSDPAIKA